MNDRFFWLAFSAFPGVGPVRFKQILKHFGSARDAWKASDDDLRKTGIGEKLVEKLDRFRKTFLIEDYVKKLKDKEVQFLTLADEDYPKLLKEISNPPFVLYFKGAEVGNENFRVHNAKKGSAVDSKQKPANAHSENFVTSPRLIAVVGTRKITNYGREVTKMLVSELVANGFTIVSGLAIGIDSAAHEATIESGGKTIAVLGCGVDCVTPSSNQALYNSIVGGHGCAVSEFAPGQPPTKGSFLSRNRIIAGLSLGVLVTEGAEDSGALTTADYAFKFNRLVFAVPGPITSSLSKGPHKLLSKGAKLVTSGEDILKEFQIPNSKFQIKSKVQKAKRIKGETKEEETILKILENEDLHIDEIIRRSGFNTAKIGSLLSLMEVKGVVSDIGAGVFSLAR